MITAFFVHVFESKKVRSVDGRRRMETSRGYSLLSISDDGE
jgi:hypothetical protein